jgi:hypothetical protein
MDSPTPPVNHAPGIHADKLRFVAACQSLMFRSRSQRGVRCRGSRPSGRRSRAVNESALTGATSARRLETCMTSTRHDAPRRRGGPLDVLQLPTVMLPSGQASAAATLRRSGVPSLISVRESFEVLITRPADHRVSAPTSRQLARRLPSAQSDGVGRSRDWVPLLRQTTCEAAIT